ncbi:VWA domain-containing protein [Vibrio sp. 10N.261.51.F12]|uniref:VWA domain-containing protein n=1 Tax=Vibrio sp. 10N.261.51.F12 TaxID=3229679 RepID=UPI0035539E94
MSDIWSNLTFGAPLWLWLLPTPLFVMRWAPPFQTKKTAIKVPFLSVLADVLPIRPTKGASQLKPTQSQRFLLLLNWIILVIAMTQPIILGATQQQTFFGRDIMVVTDLSGSMANTDFSDQNNKKISRLDAAKHVLTDFVTQRQGDRLGLILFGDAAFIQTPFTTDQTVWLELLNQTDVGMAGESTHLGDAIGLTIKAFTPDIDTSTSVTRDKVAIILTDGNDTGSDVSPVEAAKMAKIAGIKLHVIAIGNPDTIGDEAMDMDVIRDIAFESGGQAFQALDTTSLAQAYDVISELEPSKFESKPFRPKQSIHHFFIGLSLMISTLFIGLSVWSQRRV